MRASAREPKDYNDDKPTVDTTKKAKNDTKPSQSKQSTKVENSSTKNKPSKTSGVEKVNSEQNQDSPDKTKNTSAEAKKEIFTDAFPKTRLSASNKPAKTYVEKEESEESPVKFGSKKGAKTGDTDFKPSKEVLSNSSLSNKRKQPTQPNAPSKKGRHDDEVYAEAASTNKTEFTCKTCSFKAGNENMMIIHQNLMHSKGTGQPSPSKPLTSLASLKRETLNGQKYGLNTIMNGISPSKMNNLLGNKTSLRDLATSAQSRMSLMNNKFLTPPPKTTDDLRSKYLNLLPSSNPLLPRSRASGTDLLSTKNRLSSLLPDYKAPGTDLRSC
jgi:hypothetical protein